MLLIYTPSINNRVQYVFELFFNNILKVAYEITSDINRFAVYEGAKISYADVPISNELFFKRTDLLNQTNIRHQEVKCLETVCEDYLLKGFFSIDDSPFSFDVFASAFYLIARYEEYTNPEKDIHGRFLAENSVAYQSHFLQEPMINYYALEIKKLLNHKYPSLQIEQEYYKVLNTVDVDMAWKYKHKGGKRNLLGALRDLLHLDFKMIKERVNVLANRITDPFQTFAWLVAESKTFDNPIRFFWLLGNYGQFDKNIDYRDAAFRQLIQNLGSESGIHFSYASHSTKDGFDKEQQRFKSITNGSATANRFHFLKFQLGKSYQNSIKSGIKTDYSMGYPAHEGFRASIAHPFFWYDLEQEQSTDLLVVPFMFMDASFRYHHQLSDHEIRAKIQHLIAKTKMVNGKFVALWHNDTFDDSKNNWKQIYQWFNQIAK